MHSKSKKYAGYLGWDLSYKISLVWVCDLHWLSIKLNLPQNGTLIRIKQLEPSECI